MTEQVKQLRKKALQQKRNAKNRVYSEDVQSLSVDTLNYKERKSSTEILQQLRYGK